MSCQHNFIYWIALQNLFYQNPKNALILLNEFDSPENIFKKCKFIDFIKKFNSWKECEKSLVYCEKNNIKIITIQDSLYPTYLKEIYDPPVLLMVKGEYEILNQTCIAIVGARKASSYGREIAYELGLGLAAKGVIVTSGMAYGVDISAHKGALQTGKTVAVWGTSIDNCYPSSFIDISRQIEESGCIVSEFPISTPGFPSNFPQRNRIISGLSKGVVIVEAAKKSGSLITARFALEQGRDVFAVPGLAKSNLSEGPHLLLKNGAIFTESCEDILSTVKNSRHFVNDSNNGESFLRYIDKKEVVNFEIIIQRSGLGASEVLKQLTYLTVNDQIEELPGKKFRRKL